MNIKYYKTITKPLKFIVNIELGQSPLDDRECCIITIDGAILANHINYKYKTSIPIYYGLTYHIINFFDLSLLTHDQQLKISNISSLLINIIDHNILYKFI